ncbi:hypothetical protein M422DRAFT_173946, partial [Sphaerobolus stellatus SS14]
WNSFTGSIGCDLHLQPYLDNLCDTAHFNKQGNRLDKFKLNDEEWVFLKSLHDLLDCFIYTTTNMSHSNMPLTHEVIPYIDELTDIMTNFHDDASINIAVQIAAAHGQLIMNKYHSKTDDCTIYHIAMSK